MNGLSGLASRLRPVHARGLLIAGLLVSLVPLSRRTPRTQVIRLELPPRFRETEGRVDVSWTREGDTEPLGGFTLTFPEGAPASLRREISAPDGIYRLYISLEALGKTGVTAKAPARLEIARQLSLNGAEVRVLLEDTPP
ncbi:MAG TPA: hypothetical protein VHU80_06270 [Polyangiaceae bacterium]|jgi:hypothetical protein|nr:hypothetical protein [Polyangiaceae bacterium]